MPKGIGYGGTGRRSAAKSTFTKSNVKVMRKAVKRAAAKRKAK